MKREAINVPNLLTIARGFAAIPLVWSILSARFGLALVIVFLAGLTDLLDGIIARKLDQSSDFGRLLDPIADKLLLVTTFVAVSVPGFGFEPLPWWLAALAVGRDVSILGAALVIYRVTGFSGFTPTFLGKLNTNIELWVLFLFLLTRAFSLPELLLTISVYVTAASIVVSGLHYIVHARTQIAEWLIQTAKVEPRDSTGQ